MTDSRDGQTYKTVKIGNQVWMAENLNYAYTGVLYNNSGYTSDSTSWCFSNDPANCIKYGRLYTWAAAMDSVGTWSTNGKDCGYGVQCTPIYPVRGICPEGWHLPDKAEWNTLFTAVGGASTAGSATDTARMPIPSRRCLLASGTPLVTTTLATMRTSGVPLSTIVPAHISWAWTTNSTKLTCTAAARTTGTLSAV